MDDLTDSQRAEVDRIQQRWAIVKDDSMANAVVGAVRFPAVAAEAMATAAMHDIPSLLYIIRELAKRAE